MGRRGASDGAAGGSGEEGDLVDALVARLWSGGSGKNVSSSPPLPEKRVLWEFPLIFEVRRVLSSSECGILVDFCERRGMERTAQRQTKEFAHRDNDRVSLRSPELAAALFHRLKQALPAECDSRKLPGLNSNVRLYRYSRGQAFGPHIDQSDTDGKAVSYFTVLIYLTDKTQGLVGGDTIFYEGAGRKLVEALRYAPVVGSALVHGHGEQCMMHEGGRVQSGVKYVLRTDAIYI